ncbi:MAG: hypothetical protein NTY32_02110 [Bacteroidia bacterium]|nr:hypothetical protein [Bacteroidia bacterium]
MIKAPSYKLYGFVRSDYTLDSRKVYSSAQELFSLYPMYRDMNTAGVDLNAIPSTSMSSITTRIGFNFNMPTDFLGAQKASSKIEMDFTGTPVFMNLNIRHAYTQLQWEHSSLLVGHTWHPMFTLGVVPSVFSLNTGALFQPYNRSPQIRYDYLIRSIRLTAAAIYQLQNASVGPDPTAPTTTLGSNIFQRNALVPEWYVSLETKTEHLLVGLGGEYKSIMPNRYFTDASGVKQVNKNILRTPALMLYGTLTFKKLTISAKGILGQNLSEMFLIGGYVVTPDNTYIASNSMTSFVQFNYGMKHQVGLFGGFSKNLGPSNDQPTGSSFYGFGIKNWKLGVELEYTNAAWGTRSPIGSIINTERVSNARIYAIIAFTF